MIPESPGFNHGEYVNNRMSTWRNGEPFDEDGKKWSTTICHAWFVWEKDSKTEPVVRWL